MRAEPLSNSKGRVVYRGKVPRPAEKKIRIQKYKADRARLHRLFVMLVMHIVRAARC